MKTLRINRCDCAVRNAKQNIPNQVTFIVHHRKSLTEILLLNSHFNNLFILNTFMHYILKTFSYCLSKIIYFLRQNINFQR